MNQNQACQINNSSGKCKTVIYWIIQVAAIASVVFLIATEEPIFIFFYIASFIAQLFHPSFFYLLNRHQELSIYEKMKQIFSSIPTITFHCECFHTEVIIEKTKDKKGSTESETRRTEKVTTFRDNRQFMYYSVKDISGLFKLDIPSAYVNQKPYIKLYLEKEINFAEPISFSDYKYQKEQFWSEHRMRDQQIEITETRDIPNFSNYNLVKTGVTEPKYIGVFWYILFTIIPVTQFYRNYFDSLCFEQKFTIRKLLSTRYNLNEAEFASKYSAFNPSLSLNEQKYYYDNQSTGYVFENVEVNYPSLEEINAANKEYKKNIPQYNVYDSGLKAGVVRDTNGFQSGFYNIPPAPNSNQY